MEMQLLKLCVCIWEREGLQMIFNLKKLLEHHKLKLDSPVKVFSRKDSQSLAVRIKIDACAVVSTQNPHSDCH